MDAKPSIYMEGQIAGAARRRRQHERSSAVGGRGESRSTPPDSTDSRLGGREQPRRVIRLGQQPAPEDSNLRRATCRFPVVITAWIAAKSSSRGRSAAHDPRRSLAELSGGGHGPFVIVELLTATPSVGLAGVGPDAVPGR